jgi:hypothetical protein
VIDYKTFLSLASQQALAGANPLTSPLLDIEMTAETLVPDVFQSVSLSYAADAQKASLLSRDHTITLTDGSGTIPDTVLTQCKFNSTAYLESDTAATQASLVRTWLDFVTPSTTDRLLARYHIKDQTIYWIEANAAFESGVGIDGDIVLNIPSTPEIPATEDDDLVVADEVLSDLITSLAQRLRGVLEKAA